MSEPQPPLAQSDESHWRNGDLGAALVALLEEALPAKDDESN
ncbi:hypothetical protein [Ferrimonas balearica]|nr:hypothetical protein [Ferrimonas balearica]